jgi:photosystem II stability/assembly factor-like uncharacterized protein
VDCDEARSPCSGTGGAFVDRRRHCGRRLHFNDEWRTGRRNRNAAAGDGIVVAASERQQVNLAGTPSSSPFVGGHRLLRATAPGGPWTTVASLGPTAAAHNDTTAAYNAQLFYLVQAFRGGWTADTTVQMAHSLAMASGTDRVGGSGAGTPLTSPHTTAGTQLAALTVADGTRLTPAPWPSTPNYYGGAFYLDATHGWAPGTGGAMSAFDGTSWSRQTTGTTQNLEQVVFASQTTGWAVGSAGTILKTTSGGAAWSPQTSGTAQTIWDVDCISTTTCWTVGSGGTILVTTDGGSIWTPQVSGTTQTLWELDCISVATCWAVGTAGTIIKTTNGGTTWAAQSSGVTTQLLGLSCVSATQCWASGDGGVIRTTADGGTTWTAQTSGTAQSLWRVQMTSATVGYTVGGAATVRKTVDGGATWSALTVPNTVYYGLSCADASRCLISSGAGSVMSTSDGGSTWTEGTTSYVELVPVPITLASGGAVSSVLARVVHRTTAIPGAGTRFLLLASADGGATWTNFDLAAPTAANADVTSSVAITPIGFAPTTRVQNLRLRYAVLPRGGPVTTAIDLVHVDVN